MSNAKVDVEKINATFWKLTMLMKPCFSTKKLDHLQEVLFYNLVKVRH